MNRARRSLRSQFGLVCAVAALLLLAAGTVWGSTIIGSDEGALTADTVEGAVVALSIAATVGVGGLLARRRAENRVGWFLLLSGACWSGLVFTETYARQALVVEPGSLPGGTAALWFATWLWLAGIFTLPGVLLYFPDGALVSRRWRPVAWAWGGGLFATLVAQWTVGWGSDGYSYAWAPELANPLHVASVEPLRASLATVGGVLLAVAVLGSLASVAFRFRRSDGVERQQMKWVVYGIGAAVFVHATTVGVGIAYESFTGARMLPLHTEGATFGFVLASLPSTIGLAVLRYRLYDIDRIVSRTVSYLGLSVALLAVYASGVLVLGGVVRGVFGDASNDLVVAASTLAVAAAFGPARRRTQSFVDRRFNRASYDAARTVESFAQRLRDELDLEALLDELRAVTVTSVRPTQVAVWTRQQWIPDAADGRTP